jgi:ATP-dependent Clp protease ATP-binding subunit ClpC
MHLEVTAALMDRIVADGFDAAYGARPLKRAITRLVDDPLSDALLAGVLVEGDVARLDVAGEDDKGDARVTVTALKPGAARRRAAGDTGLKSEVVYSSLTARRRAKAAAALKVRAANNVKA